MVAPPVGAAKGVDETATGAPGACCRGDSLVVSLTKSSSAIQGGGRQIHKPGFAGHTTLVY